MKAWIKNVGKFGLAIAKATIPQVNAIESAVKTLKSDASGSAKRDAVKEIAVNSLSLAEFAADKDLLDDAQVSAAYDDFIGSYVKFQEALATAKAAKP